MGGYIKLKHYSPIEPNDFYIKLENWFEKGKQVIFLVQADFS